MGNLAAHGIHFLGEEKGFFNQFLSFILNILPRGLIFLLIVDKNRQTNLFDRFLEPQAHIFANFLGLCALSVADQSL